jgi:serine/threonine-protein kinase
VAQQAIDLPQLESPPQSARVASGVRLGSIPANSEEDLRFVQDRLAMFARITFLISAMFLIVTTFADAVGEVKRYQLLGRVSHVAGTLVALGLWLSMRSRHAISPRSLQLLDLTGTLAICWSFAVLGHFTMQPYGWYTGLLAMTHVSICRAMMVPSVPRRTLILALASFGALVVSRLLLPLDYGGIAVGTSLRTRGVVEALLWGTAGTAVATLASIVIYGLHEKAREARQLGQYYLEQKIGHGGMGEVYRARHAMLRRPTAVKLLTGDGSEAQLRRFEKEVRLTARLTHPNTISVFDYGRTPDGIFYYAMELLDGMTLEELVKHHGPQPPGRVIHILLQVCGALTEAHHVGLVHRDIKPANIHLSRRGEIPDFVKVLDFGLVREVDRGDRGKASQSNVNTVVGTPLYMSPEAILTPDDISARADLYGLGCVAYFLLTGRPPFEGDSVVAICASHLHTPPLPLSQHLEVPADLERVILSCLAKNPDDRPESAAALARELAACADASSYQPGDAEAFWTRLGREPAPPPSSKPAPVDAHCRTICCVDLQRRLEGEPQDSTRPDVRDETAMSRRGRERRAS